MAVDFDRLLRLRLVVGRHGEMDRDFLVSWLYPQYEAGAYRLGTDDVVAYLGTLSSKPHIARRGRTLGLARRSARPSSLMPRQSFRSRT